MQMSGTGGSLVEYINISGAREHNLKNIDVNIPKNQLVCFTGKSGSGKSSLIFDTLYAESFRRFLDARSTPVYTMGGGSWNSLKRPKVKSIQGLPPALGLSQRQGVAGQLSTVGTLCGVSDLLRVFFAAFGEVWCSTHHIPLVSQTYADIQEDILERYSGQTIILVARIAEKRKGTFAKEIKKLRSEGFSKLRANGVVYSLQEDDIKLDVKKLNTVDLLVDKIANLSEKRLRRLERALIDSLKYGEGVVRVETEESEKVYNTKAVCPHCGESAAKLDPRHLSHSSLGQCEDCGGSGVEGEEGFEDLHPCHTCDGSRLNKEAIRVKVLGKSIADYTQLHVEDLLSTLKSQSWVDFANETAARLKVYREMVRTLVQMNELDLKHLSLNRAGSTLAPGDLQRLRLANMLSNTLQGALYVIDEPCQGLTKPEVDNLVLVLRKLVKAGASVVAVEHHPRFLESCDTVFQMGPEAGVRGGEVVSETSPKKGRKASAKALKKGKKSSDRVEFSLKNVRGLQFPKSVAIEQGEVNIIRGPSGAGKSTFINMCLMPFLQRELCEETYLETDFVTEKKFGDVFVKGLQDVRPGSMKRASRRSVASALDILVPLRELFAKLTQSQVLGLTPSHFSWHSKVGQCPDCSGRGFVEVQQRYGAPVRLTCETCLGYKLASRSLVPRFQGLNFAEVMELTLEDAVNQFQNQPKIYQRLKPAFDFGLGYVRLGQTMESLSGGEMQRLSLTIELRRQTLEGMWFLLVHPSTGLHLPDIQTLSRLMDEMKEKGATFVVVDNREEILGTHTKIVDFMTNP